MVANVADVSTGSLAVASPLLIDVHTTFAWVVVVTNGVAGAWSLIGHYVEAVRHRALWWFTAVAELAIFAQVVLGVVLAQGYGGDGLKMHMFYGFVAAFTVAIVYSYRAQLEPHRYLLYGLGGLFLMGLCLRAIYLNPA